MSTTITDIATTIGIDANGENTTTSIAGAATRRTGTAGMITTDIIDRKVGSNRSFVFLRGKAVVQDFKKNCGSTPLSVKR